MRSLKMLDVCMSARLSFMFLQLCSCSCWHTRSCPAGREVSHGSTNPMCSPSVLWHLSHKQDTLQGLFQSEINWVSHILTKRGTGLCSLPLFLQQPGMHQCPESCSCSHLLAACPCLRTHKSLSWWRSQIATLNCLVCME